MFPSPSPNTATPLQALYIPADWLWKDSKRKTGLKFPSYIRRTWEYLSKVEPGWLANSKPQPGADEQSTDCPVRPTLLLAVAQSWEAPSVPDPGPSEDPVPSGADQWEGIRRPLLAGALQGTWG